MYLYFDLGIRISAERKNTFFPFRECQNCGYFNRSKQKTNADAYTSAEKGDA
jgi:hypothetical protein